MGKSDTGKKAKNKPEVSECTAKNGSAEKKEQDTNTKKGQISDGLCFFLAKTLVATITVTGIVLFLFSFLVIMCFRGEALIEFSTNSIDNSTEQPLSMFDALTSQDIEIRAETVNSPFTQESVAFSACYSAKQFLQFSVEDSHGTGILLAANGTDFLQKMNTSGTDMQNSYLFIPNASELQITISWDGTTTEQYCSVFFGGDSEASFTPAASKLFECYSSAIRINPSRNIMDNGSNRLVPSAINIEIPNASHSDIKIVNIQGNQKELTASDIEALSCIDKGSSCCMTLNNLLELSIQSGNNNTIRFDTLNHSNYNMILIAEQATRVYSYLSGRLLFRYYDEPEEYNLRKQLTLIDQANCQVAIKATKSSFSTIHKIEEMEVSGRANTVIVSGNDLFPTFKKWFRNKVKDPQTLLSFFLSFLGISVGGILLKKREETSKVRDKTGKEETEKGSYATP